MKETVVTFFGHKDTPEGIEEILRQTIIDLIENKNATVFYVGNHGNFDAMVCRQLKGLSKLYPIKYYVVLAYMPTVKGEYDERTVLCEGVESVPPKFAVNYRNDWMLGKADIVITYVTRRFGGAYRFKCIAEKRARSVIELSEVAYQVNNVQY